MASTQARSLLQVEGINDKWPVIELLIRHGIDYNTKPWPPNYPSIEETKDDRNRPSGVETLLKSFVTTVKASSNRTVGFMLDADDSIADRWRAITDRLINSGVVDIPQLPPADGFIGHSAQTNTRVGVWLMPDNQRDGKLEDFLKSLIDENDPLISYANTARDEAVRRGAEFRDNDSDKALLHTWLAWQKSPGMPYGTAMKLRYFRDDSEIATRFVNWFRTLFQIDQS